MLSRSVLSVGLSFSLITLSRAEDYPPMKLGLTTQVVSTGFEFEPLAGGDTLRYRPAQSNYAGLIFGYRWLGSTLTFAVPATDEIQAAEGKSDYADYRFSLYWKRLGIEAGYNSFKRYIIENSSALSSSTLDGQRYYALPDFTSKGFGLNIMWALGEGSYGLDAAIDQSAWQQDSGGAWLVLMSWRQQQLKNSGPIIPTEKQASFGEDGLLKEASMGTYAAGGGYGYNYVSGSFFIAPLIAISGGLQHISYLAGTERKQSSKVTYNAHTRLSLGFNAQSYFVTLVGYIDVFAREIKSLRMNTLVQGFSFNAGLRF